MNALVIGYGSIGARHARLLAEAGCATAVVSRREVDFPVVFRGLPEALARGEPDYVVIANETSRHEETFAALAETGYAGTLLVEKPLFGSESAIPRNAFRAVFVGYNLRFHPVLQRLRALVNGKKVLSIHAYVGQYLPHWRPSADYRQSSSASAKMDGGVLRDLSHELDYVTWLFGDWKKVAAIGGHFSDLEIDTDDVFGLLLETERCLAITMQMNYLDRRTRRFVIVNTPVSTIEADLFAQTISVDGECESMPVDRDFTYRSMHDAILSRKATAACTLAEGLETVRLIDAAEKSADRGMWVQR